MPTIRVKENEPFEVAMRRFKRAIEKTGLLTELRAREAYEKPTTERKRKKAAAAKRLQKRLRSQQLPPNVLSRNAYPFSKKHRIRLRCFLFYNARFPIRTRKLK